MTPDYIICLECEAPCYVFEYKDGKITEALCTTCYNEDCDQFATEDDYEALAMDTRFSDHR
jgi:hypothetical protein